MSVYLRHDRPTIGFLTHSLHDDYARSLWNGVVDAAQALEVNLLIFPGSGLGRTDMQGQENILYQLAGAENVDGLVISGGPMSNFVGVEGLKAYCQSRWPSLPLAFIAIVPDGYSGIVVDNSSGMEAAVHHLIEVHGRRRIAFLSGLAGNPEMAVRYQAYVKVLQAHGLPLDPDLVSQPNKLGYVDGQNIGYVYGQNAVHLLVAQRQVKFDAIVSSIDVMAMGAMDTLSQYGLSVPKDVALTGFNNELRTQGTNPPLTTVHQPIYQQAYRALEMVVAQLRGDTTVRVETLRTELVVRQSCGCLPRTVQQMAVDLTDATAGSLELLDAHQLEQALALSQVDLPDPDLRQQFISAFWSDLFEDGETGFLQTFSTILQQALARRGNMMLWQNMISELRRVLLPHLAGSSTRLYRAENLWQQGRGLVAEMIVAVEVALRNDIFASQERMHWVSYDLSNTFDTERIMAILLAQMPGLNIKGCYVALYEPGEASPVEWSTLILAYDEQEQANLVAQGGRRFPTRQLLPAEKWSQLAQYHLIVAPLYFRQDQIGLILFQVGTHRDGAVFGSLRQQLSSALKGAQILLEQQQAYQTLRENQEKLLVAEKMASIGRLTASIAHEMNTPLAAIRTALLEVMALAAEYQSSIGDATVVEDDHRAIAHEMHQSLNGIDQAAEQAINFVRSVKAQTSDLDFTQPEYFNLETVIQDTLIFLGHALLKGNCRVNFESNGSNLQLYGSPGRLAQVLTSLVLNAIEASASQEQEGGLIDIRTRASAAGIELQVADQGCGIAPEHLPKIFDPIFTTKPFGQASGLGLTMARDIVKSDFGGTIQVSSQVGQGTTVTINFPTETAAPRSG